jgi:CRP-like cAMP-binding protein
MVPTSEEIAVRYPALTAHLRREDVAVFAGALTARPLAAGTALVTEGTPSDTLYLVWEGALAVRVSGDGAVARLGPGEVVGEISLVDGGPASATVAAEGAATVLVLDRPSLAELERSHPRVAAAIYQAIGATLAARLKEVSERFEVLDLGTEPEPRKAGIGKLWWTLIGVKK